MKLASSFWCQIIIQHSFPRLGSDSPWVVFHCEAGEMKKKLGQFKRRRVLFHGWGGRRRRLHRDPAASAICSRALAQNEYVRGPSKTDVHEFFANGPLAHKISALGCPSPNQCGCADVIYRWSHPHVLSTKAAFISLQLMSSIGNLRGPHRTFRRYFWRQK